MDCYEANVCEIGRLSKFTKIFTGRESEGKMVCKRETISNLLHDLSVHFKCLAET